MTTEKNYHFFVDAQKYDVEKAALTGAEIKGMIAGFNPAYQLYLEEPGDEPDRPVADTETVSLEPGKGHGVRKFYTVPPATFGTA